MVRRFGYTLIELLIVIAILGTSGALLIPMLGDRDDFDTQAAIRRLIADLTFAQSDALANQEHRRLVFLPDTEQDGRFRGWCIVKLAESQLGAPFDANSAVYVQDPLAPSGTNGNYIADLYSDERFGKAFIASVDLDGGATAITYDELGGTVTSSGQPGTGGTIVVRGGGVAYEITIDGVTGKVSVADITNATPELEVGGSVVGG
ncbi:MAG: prepilin-type N-terminal cleavage/methylation domain-containing protein [Phycisphaerae bacterium]|nr:prepilin-type N-terminal cleavage/methylation domain-containing protein [Phycisphaerae bacterium]